MGICLPLERKPNASPKDEWLGQKGSASKLDEHLEVLLRPACCLGCMIGQSEPSTDGQEIEQLKVPSARVLSGLYGQGITSGIDQLITQFDRKVKQIRQPSTIPCCQVIIEHSIITFSFQSRP
jgi:hypothetical protein